MLKLPMFPMNESDIHLLDQFEENPYPLNWYRARIGAGSWEGRFICSNNLVTSDVCGFLLYKTEAASGARFIKVFIIGAEHRRRGIGTRVFRRLQEVSSHLEMIVPEECLDLQLFLKAMGFKGKIIGPKGNHLDSGYLFSWEGSQPAEKEVSSFREHGY